MSPRLIHPVYVKNSSVHGRGVFSRRPIPDDSYIGRYLGRQTRVDGTYVLWIREEDGSNTGIDGQMPLKYLNHSSHPNAELIGDELYSLREIGPDEEITIHYGKEWASVA